MQNIILHLDMNSYFATVEQQDNLEWRGKVLGVCEHLGGIIIAASIEAKKWGIKTGTPVWEAKKIYPKIILTHTRAEAYRKYNQLVTKLASEFTDQVEVASIDEVVLDITKVCNIKCNNEDVRYKNTKHALHPASHMLNYIDPFEEAVRVALEIKRRMKKEVGDYLTCSVGIADNKLLAKIASDLQKPDGLVVIMNHEFGIMNYECPISNSSGHLKNPQGILKENPTFSSVPACPVGRGKGSGAVVFTKAELYQKLKLTDIPGIGRRQEKNLNRLGLHSLNDLKNCPKSVLVARFGVIGGHHLYNMGQLQGSFKSQVKQEQEIKSMGHMYTLPKEFRKEEFFEPVLFKLCEMVAGRLRRKNLSGSSLFVHVHDLSDKCYSQAERLKFTLGDGREIFLHARRMLRVGNMACKLVGVTVGDLCPKLKQQSLFGIEEKNSQLLVALDKINSKYGEFTVVRVEAIMAGKVFRDSVGFGRIKEL